MKLIILVLCLLITGCNTKTTTIDNNENNNITKKEPQISINLENSKLKNSEIKLQTLDGNNYIVGILKNESGEEITISNITISIFNSSTDIADQVFYNTVSEKISASSEYLLNVNVGKDDLSNASIKISVVTKN